jgi:zinc and cadmium transporter
MAPLLLDIASQILRWAADLLAMGTRPSVGFALSSGIIFFVLAVSAESLVYVATADLIPGLHGLTRPRSGVHPLLLMLPGIATVVLVPWLVALGRSALMLLGAKVGCCAA